MQGFLPGWRGWLAAAGLALGLAMPAVAGAAGSGPVQGVSDSLRALLRHAPTDSAHARLLVQLGRAYLPLNSDSALALAQRARHYAQRNRQPYWEAKALGLLAAGYYYKEDFPRASGFRRQEIALWHALGRTANEHNAIRQLGWLEVLKSNYPQGLELLLRALRYFERTPERREYASALSDVYGVYKEMGNKPKALHYFRLWKKQVEADPRDTPQEIVDNALNISLFYTWLGNYAAALAEAKKMQHAYRGPAVTADNGSLLLCMATSYHGLGQLALARRYAAEALAVNEQLHLPAQTINSRIALAESLDKLGQHDQARALIRQAVAEAEALHNQRIQSAAYFSAAGIAENGRRFDQSLGYLRQYLDVQDSLFNDHNQQQAQAAQTTYDDYQHQRQVAAARHRLAQLRSERRITQLYLALLGLGLLASGVAVVLLMRQRRLQAERDAAKRRTYEAEAEAEQLRIGEALRQSHHELAHKNGQLVSMALNATQQGQLMDNVKEELKSVAQTSEGTARNRLHRLQQSIAINAQASRTSGELHQVLEQVHPSFLAAVREQFPSLTLHEQRLLALLRLSLSTKEMAGLLSISEAGVKKARYRLRRKLELGTEESLRQLVAKLGQAAK